MCYLGHKFFSSWKQKFPQQWVSHFLLGPSLWISILTLNIDFPPQQYTFNRAICLSHPNKNVWCCNRSKIWEIYFKVQIRCLHNASASVFALASRLFPLWKVMSHRPSRTNGTSDHSSTLLSNLHSSQVERGLGKCYCQIDKQFLETRETYRLLTSIKVNFQSSSISPLISKHVYANPPWMWISVWGINVI